MALILVGISHHTAPLELRERLTYGPGESAAAIEAFRTTVGASEAVLLSTCNRTEVYAYGGSPDATSALSSAFLERVGSRDPALVYTHRDREVVSHLFEVASGLDSLVVGESEIHGQVRDAWERSRQHSGIVLNRLFQSALNASGLVRSQTSIGRGSGSVSSAAVQIARQIFGDLVGRRAMVIGAGEVAELALACLVEQGVSTAIVANRTFERASELARRHGARAIRFDECWEALAEVDIVLCSTAAPHPVVRHAQVASALASRGDRPLCLLDMAVPRDVEPTIGHLENVFLYDVDDLHGVVASNLSKRRQELPAAEAIVQRESARYWDWLAGLAAVPTLAAVRARVDAVRERELDDLLRRLGGLSDEQRAAIAAFSRSLMNKFLHSPTVRLRRAAADDQLGLEAISVARFLFALDEALSAPEAEAMEQGKPNVVPTE